MTHLPALEGLIERCEAAQGPDRLLDAAIFAAVVNPRTEKNFYIWQSSRPQGAPPKPDADYWDRRRTPEVTASIDAALALKERLLPGWHVREMGAGPHVVPRPRDFAYDGTWFCHLHCTTPGVLYNLSFGAGATAPLAIILATLKALRSLTKLEG